MERPRRAVLLALIAAGALAVLTASGRIRSQRPAPSPGHAFAIPSPERRILVEVLNGTTRSGLARSATRALRRQGLDVVFFGSTESAGRSRKTLVLVRRGAVSNGARVARALGTGEVAERSDPLRRVDVSVILGEDYKPPPELHP
ncbi:MAG TPA: LytR C-terminal domain-containing protein [Gemmatimonadales bacterium]|nr:LytR C-terminal domain-containing protein [Gemmatimonadales bacterium]